MFDNKAISAVLCSASSGSSTASLSISDFMPTNSTLGREAFSSAVGDSINRQTCCGLIGEQKQTLIMLRGDDSTTSIDTDNSSLASIPVLEDFTNNYNDDDSDDDDDDRSTISNTNGVSSLKDSIDLQQNKDRGNDKEKRYSSPPITQHLIEELNLNTLRDKRHQCSDVYLSKISISDPYESLPLFGESLKYNMKTSLAETFTATRQYRSKLVLSICISVTKTDMSGGKIDATKKENEFRPKYFGGKKAASAPAATAPRIAEEQEQSTAPTMLTTICENGYDVMLLNGDERKVEEGYTFSLSYTLKNRFSGKAVVVKTWKVNMFGDDCFYNDHTLLLLEESFCHRIRKEVTFLVCSRVPGWKLAAAQLILEKESFCLRPSSEASERSLATRRSSVLRIEAEPFIQKARSHTTLPWLIL